MLQLVKVNGPHILRLRNIRLCQFSCAVRLNKRELAES